MNTLCRYLSLAFTVLAALALLATPANAQEATRLPETTHDSVGLDTGLENAFIARATYVHRFTADSPLDPRLYARATLPVVAPDLGDWGFDAGLRITPLAWRDLRLAVLGGPVLMRTSTDAYSATGFGLGATLLAGYESARWGLSLESGYEQLLSTYISHTDAYRETFYADAKDGWYALSGGRARAGLRGGARIGAVEIAARAGLNTTGRLAAMTPPFYFTLGTAYAF
jgi:hypothetical protein